MNRQAFEALK